MGQMSWILSCALWAVWCRGAEVRVQQPLAHEGVFEGTAIALHAQHVPNTQGACGTYL